MLVEEKGPPTFSNPRDRVKVMLLVQKFSNGACQPLGVDLVESGFPFSKTKNAPSDNLGASNVAQCNKKWMFQIPEELLESGHMLWALCDQVYKEGTAH